MKTLAILVYSGDSSDFGESSAILVKLVNELILIDFVGVVFFKGVY